METKRKKCKVIMLPTEDKTQIYKARTFGLGFKEIPTIYTHSGQGQHLYITSDDEIKVGDFYIHMQNGYGLRFTKCISKALPMDARKIIATTDTSIGYTDRQISPVPNFCTYPQPSQAFIEKYCELGGIDEVMVEFDYNLFVDQDTEEKVESVWLKTNSHNEITIHPIKDSWNRKEVDEEIINFAEWYSGMKREQVINAYNRYKKEITC